MYSEKVIVLNKSGLHARPAMLFVQTAAKFKSSVTFGKTAAPDVFKNAKSVISVMSVAARLDDEIEIKAEGEDEKAAVEALVALIKSGCGE
ncbi:MAG: HPr family phosphocarrier protein [Clostridia bacterium]